MAEHIDLGKFGEERASEYLKKKGYKIIERNFRDFLGEIDIIAKEKNKMIVFVEVKTMRYFNDGLMPEDQMSFSKRKKFERAVLIYLSQNKKIFNERHGYRLDLVTVSVRDGGECEIKHYENI